MRPAPGSGRGARGSSRGRRGRGRARPRRATPGARPSRGRPAGAGTGREAPGLRARIARDPYARRLGIELLALAPGVCRAGLRVGPRARNFHGQAHGAAIFALADYAFSGACNAWGPAAVAASVTIHFLAPVRPGTRLLAEARAEHQGRQAGFYRIAVRDERGRLVAACQAVAVRPGGGAALAARSPAAGSGSRPPGPGTRPHPPA